MNKTFLAVLVIALILTWVGAIFLLPFPTGDTITKTQSSEFSELQVRYDSLLAVKCKVDTVYSPPDTSLQHYMKSQIINLSEQLEIVTIELEDEKRARKVAESALAKKGKYKPVQASKKGGTLVPRSVFNRVRTENKALHGMVDSLIQLANKPKVTSRGLSMRHEVRQNPIDSAIIIKHQIEMALVENENTELKGILDTMVMHTQKQQIIVDHYSTIQKLTEHELNVCRERRHFEDKDIKILWADNLEDSIPTIQVKGEMKARVDVGDALNRGRVMDEHTIDIEVSSNNKYIDQNPNYKKQFMFKSAPSRTSFNITTGFGMMVTPHPTNGFKLNPGIGVIIGFGYQVNRLGTAIKRIQ